MRNYGVAVKAFTLAELLITLLILVAVSGLVVPMLSQTPDSSRRQATIASLSNLRQAILGAGPAASSCYYNDVRAYPARLDDLVKKPSGVANFDPIAKIGWNGPYLNPSFARLNDQGNTEAIDDRLEFRDGYGGVIELQLSSDARNIRLVAPGPNQTIDSSITFASPTALTKERRHDDLVLFLNTPDPVSLEN